MKTNVVFALWAFGFVATVAGMIEPEGEPAFAVAPAGAVRPAGWLLDRARAARDGYTGHMDDVSHHFRRAWSADWRPRGKHLNWPDDMNGSWSSEGGTYWFDGLVRLAWQLDDPELKALAKRRLEPMLANMHENAMGFLWWMDRRDPKQVEEFLGPGAWQSRWLLGMRGKAVAAFWEATGDTRAKQALEWAMCDERAAQSKGSSATLVAGLVHAWRVTGSKRVRSCAALAVKELKASSQYAKPPPAWLPETLWTRRRSQNALKMPTRHGGVAAAMYGPCTFETSIKDGSAAFTEKTSYPFSEIVEIVVDDAPGTAFPLLARMPGWCAKPVVELNGGPIDIRVANGFARIERAWKKGDVLRLTFPMSPRVEVMRDMCDLGRRRAVVSYGPLLMAYAYPCKDDNTIVGNPAEPVLDVASVAGAKVVRSPMPAVWDWPLDAPVKLVAKDSAGRPLELVPYGCTKLRVSMFPVE